MFVLIINVSNLLKTVLLYIRKILKFFYYKMEFTIQQIQNINQWMTRIWRSRICEKTKSTFNNKKELCVDMTSV